TTRGDSAPGAGAEVTGQTFAETESRHPPNDQSGFDRLHFGRTGRTVIYFDTSYIVKCCLNETGSTEVRALESTEGLSSCLDGRAEFWTAVKRNVREKLITGDEVTATYERF
ncbi:MAG: hypothetical protein ABIZ56_05285, partial [Chthoniobacteraceae bacterium]